MYSVTPQFRTLLDSGAIQHIRGAVTLINGETITLTDDNVKRPTFSKQSTAEAESMGIGQMYTGTVELTLLGATSMQRELLRGGTVSLEFGLDGLDEWVPLGVWNITDPQRASADSIVIRGTDNTERLDVPITDSTVGHIMMKARMAMVTKLTGVQFAQTLEEISALAGIDVTDNAVFGTTFTTSCRTEVCAIAKFIGGFAYIDRQGRIAFRRFGDQQLAAAIPASRRFRADLSEYSYQVTAVSCKKGSKTYTTEPITGASANTQACLAITDYPYMHYAYEEDILEELGRIRDNIASAGVWIPGSFDYAGDPTIDLGDKLVLTGGAAGDFGSGFIVTAQTWQFRGAQTLISAGAKESAGTSGGSSGGSSGGGGSSTTIIEDTLSYVRMRGNAGTITGEPVSVAEAAFSAEVPTMLHISISAVIEGGANAVTALKVYIDGAELEMFSEDTVAAGELRTVHFEQMRSVSAGVHDLTVMATGSGAVKRITGAIFGRKIAADVSMIRTWGDASAFKWEDLLLLKWEDIEYETND